MFAIRDKLMAELHAWLDKRDVNHVGNTFFWLHVIDMNGPMDVERGVITKETLEGDDRVRPSTLPRAGTRASRTSTTRGAQTTCCSPGSGTTASPPTAGTTQPAIISGAGTRLTSPTRDPSG